MTSATESQPFSPALLNKIAATEPEPFPEGILEDDRYEEDATDFLDTYKIPIRSMSREWLLQKAWAAGWRTDWDSGWRCP